MQEMRMPSEERQVWSVGKGHEHIPGGKRGVSRIDNIAQIAGYILIFVIISVPWIMAEVLYKFGEGEE